MTQLSLLLFEAPVRSTGPDLGWLMGVVAILVVSIVALAFGFKKLVLGSIQSRASKRDMRVLDVLPLGGKRQLAVVRCYDRTFALGLGEKSVDLVAELDSTAIDVDKEPESRTEAFKKRLESARSQLLGENEVIVPTAPPVVAPVVAPVAPAAASAPAPSSAPVPPEPKGKAFVPGPVSTPPPAGSTREFIA